MLVTVAGGCGGGVAATRAAKRPPDARKLAMEAFVAAAGRGDAEEMWRLLSLPTRRRYGLSLARFRRTGAVELSEGVGAFAHSGYRFVISEGLRDRFGIVAIAGERTVEGTRELAAYAAVVRWRGDAWRLELGGPVRLRPTGSARRLVVDVGGAPALVEGELWLDGTRLDTGATGIQRLKPPGPLAIRLFGDRAAPPAPGVHVAVAFASSGDDASALAWTFRVGR